MKYVCKVNLVKQQKPEFDEASHRYSLNSVNYTPVTSFIHNFEPIKDWNDIVDKYISRRSYEELVADLESKYQMKHPTLDVQYVLSLYGVKEGVKYIWNLEKERACLEGTDFHKLQENKDIKISGKIGKDFNFSDINNIEDGIYTEVRCWSHEHLICGTVDRIELKTNHVGRRVVNIEDYKTNKELKVNYNYINKYGEFIVNEYMQVPLNHLVNCNYVHYNLQLSLYAYFLEQFGYEVGTLKLLHTHNYSEDNLKEYYIDYLKDDVINMLYW